MEKYLKSATGRVGQPDRIVMEENRRTVLHMTRQGHTAREIATRLGIAQRNVTRWRMILRRDGEL